MGRYGRVGETRESCVETKKHLKNEIKREKKKLRDFMDVTDRIDMSWEARQQTVGSMYIQIEGMERRLKENYGKK